MGWNYRVMRHEILQSVAGQPDEVEIHYGIHEVYYDRDGNVQNWTSLPVSLWGEEADFSWMMSRFGEAITKPILDHKTGREI